MRTNGKAGGTGVREELEIRYDQARITPFWRKLPFLFLYPFRFGPLVVLLALVAASALAGMALGSFSLVFRGLLVYVGLRYAFNVLDLFARGRFEGESPDHSLWGTEKRPAKLGLLIALFLSACAMLGNFALERRLARDAGAQERLAALYRQDHARELRSFALEHQEWEQRRAERAARLVAPPRPAQAYGSQEPEEPSEPVPPLAAAELEADDPEPSYGITREQMVREYHPRLGDALWFQLQPPWFWLAAILLSFVLPAGAVVIALEDRFFRALNPLNVFHLVGAMKGAYFVLWGFFLLIAGARHAAFTVGEHWPAMVRLPVEMALVTYLGFVLFALMGYALYQHHQELHLEVDVDFDGHREAGGAEAIAGAGSARAAVAAAPQDPWERKLQALEAAGQYREAIAEVKDRMRYDRHDLALNARLHGLYVRLGDRDVILTHGQQYLAALARARQGAQALQVIRALQALDGSFQPQEPDIVLPAATAALQQGDARAASALLRGFDKRFPQHPDTAGVFFLGARLLSEQSRQHAQAARILKALLQRFPEHPVAGEARTYLEVLEKALPAEAAGA